MTIKEELNEVIAEFQWEFLNANTSSQIIWSIEQIIYRRDLDNPNRVKLSISPASGNGLKIEPLNLFTLICLSGYDDIPKTLLPEVGSYETYRAVYEVYYQLGQHFGSNVYPKTISQTREEIITDLICGEKEI